MENNLPKYCNELRNQRNYLRSLGAALLRKADVFVSNGEMPD